MAMSSKSAAAVVTGRSTKSPNGLLVLLLTSVTISMVQVDGSVARVA